MNTLVKFENLLRSSQCILQGTHIKSKYYCLQFAKPRFVVIKIKKIFWKSKCHTFTFKYKQLSRKPTPMCHETEHIIKGGAYYLFKDQTVSTVDAHFS